MNINKDYLKKQYNFFTNLEQGIDVLFAIPYKDSCLIVIKPSLDMLLHESYDNQPMHVSTEENNFYVLDFIQYCSEIIKSNYEYIRTLFCEDKIINSKYRECINKLFDFRETIIQEDQQYIFTNMAEECDKIFSKFLSFINCYHNPQNKKEYIEESKKLIKIIRYSCTISGYINEDLSFESALNYCPTLVDMVINQINNNDIEYKELKFTIHNTIKQILDNIDRLDNKSNTSTVKQYLFKICENIMNLNHETKPSLDLSKYDNIWFTSDLHFGHSNILQFDQRQNIGTYKNITDIDVHDKAIIENWNNVVGDNDLVFILGDLSYRNVQETTQILCHLKGDKILIKGNHDHRFLDKSDFNDKLFLDIKDYMEITYNNQEIILMHYPISRFKHMTLEENHSIHLFGHLHGRPLIIPRYSHNVGVDVNNFKPIHINECIKLAKENIGGQYNKGGEQENV